MVKNREASILRYFMSRSLVILLTVRLRLCAIKSKELMVNVKHGR
jgi:hypothetical protein